MYSWEQRKFGDLFEYERPDAYIVKSDNYNNDFNMPVLTANKAFILGYTNEENSYNKPSIIFDDFTLDRKYVDFPYMLKSSAIKILTSKNQHNLRFLFERLNSTRFEVLGHARHYISVVQNTTTLCPSIDEEVCISNLLTKFDELITLHQRKLDNLKLKKKALLQKLFPKNGDRYPELRFPGFTDAWEQRKLESLFTKYEDKVNTPSSGYWRLGLRSHCKGTFHTYIDAGNELETAEMNRVKSGNFILNITFAWERALAVTNDEDQDKLVSHRFPQFKPNNDLVIDFFKHTLMDKRFKHHLELSSPGGAGRNKVLKVADMLKYELLVPSIKEQNKISSFLNHVDYIITLHQRKLDNLKLKKKALLQKLFPKNGDRYPELRFPGFTDAWEQRKLGDIATFSKGNGYSKSDLASFGDPIILYGRLYTNYETTISNIDTFVELKDKSVISQGGEVIVPASGETAEDISRASVVKKQGIIIGGDLNVIKANHLLDPTFLALTISNGEQQKELSKRAQGKSVVHLHNSDLQEVNLTFPVLNEQKKISTLFEKMDNIITLHQRKLDHLQLQKKALLQQMFV